MSPCHPIIPLLSAAPGFVRWESPRLLPAAIAGGALLAAAVVWFYPAQVRLVRRPWRWLMPGLRALGLLALALALARPVAVRREPAGERGTVAILVDRSGSMDVTDGGRSREELVALADALGLLPPGVRDGARGVPAGAQSGAATRPASSGVSAASAASPAPSASGPSTSPASPAPITSISQLAGAFAEVRSAAQQAFRAQGDLDYARVSGQGIEAARERLDQSAARLSELAHALAQSARPLLPGAGDAALRESLLALNRLAAPDGRGTWVAAARAKIDQAGKALSEYQSGADRRLYDSDPAVQAACRAVAQRNRFDLACAALLRPGTGLVARLGDKTRCAGFAFADDVTPLGTLHPNPSAALAAAPESPGGAAEQDLDDQEFGPAPDRAAKSGGARLAAPLLPVKPDGPGTDLAGAVTGALARLNPRTVRAVVVLSDGRDVGASGGAPPPSASGIPVFAVAVAPAAAAPRDRALDQVRIPAKAFVGETVSVRASVRATGEHMSADPADIRLVLGDGTEKSPQPRLHRHSIEYPIKLKQAGAQEVTLTLPPVAGEATDLNNTARQWIKVMPTKLRVAAYAGTAEWDFQYLRGALSRTEYVQLDAGVLGPAHPVLPLTPAQILQQDVLILYDVPVSALDDNQWDAVYNKLVKERGGSVILVAGSGGAVLDYGSKIAASALLPFDPARVKPAWKVWPGERPNFRLAPAPNWESSDFAEALRLDTTGDANRRWQDLPPLYRVMPIPVSQLKPNAQAMLVEQESKAAVLSETRPGLGRSLLLGMNESWRWRLGVGERFQDRFWLQLVRFAAGEPYAAREGPVALDLDSVSVAPGHPVRVRVRFYEQAMESAAVAHPSSMRVEVLSRGTDGKERKVVRTAALSRAAVGSGRWETTLNDLPIGDYQVQFQPPAVPGSDPGSVPGSDSVAPRAGPEPGPDQVSPESTEPPAAAEPGPPAPPRLQLPLHVAGGMEDEMRDVSGNLERLHRLAESTGGEVVRLDEIGSLPDRLANLGETHPRVTEIRLWDSPYLFAFVVACFAAEWALRKRFGLA